MKHFRADTKVPYSLEEVPLTQTERRSLLGVHQPRFTREVDTGELPPVPPIELEVPECCHCGEPWANGCSTIRAVLREGVLADMLGTRERELLDAQRYIAEVGMRGRWASDPDRDVMRLEAVLDGGAIRYGGHEAIRGFLEKVHKKIVATTGAMTG